MENWQRELLSWDDRTPPRTILLTRGMKRSDVTRGAEFDHILHIALISDPGTSLCGTSCWETESVTRVDLFCGKCWDAHWAINTLEIDGYELGQLTAICQEAQDELTATPIAKPKSDYAEYLASDHWQHMRKIALEHYGDQCALCGSKDQLDVHHRTYVRRGKELLKDLTVLCRGCHSLYHQQAS